MCKASPHSREFFQKRIGRAHRPRSSPTLLPTVAGFANFYEQEAVFEHGPPTSALNRLRDTYRPVLEAGLTTTPEALLADFSHVEKPMEKTLLASLCHGWSAGPCYFLPRHVLGIRPAEPGFRRVGIWPRLGDLAWARGSVPTPHGLFEVEWENNDGEVRGTFRLPEGIES